MMKYLHLGLILFFTPCFIQAQDCGCEDHFAWVKKTFEENDAGFSYALEQKGQDAYEAHNLKFQARVAEIDNFQECATTMYDWMTFFRKGHISIRNTAQRSRGAKGPSKKALRAQFADWEKLDIDPKEFEAKIAQMKEPSMEGIWQTSVYTIGITQQEGEYIGFILKADGAWWTEGQVKLKIQPKKAEGEYSGTFFMRDHSPREAESVYLVGPNHLQMGSIDLERVNSPFPSDPKVVQYFKSASAQMPYLEVISDQTVMLRVPSFNMQVRPIIDSIMKANHEVLTQHPNFIIDIRGNGGGSDASYDEILPYLYTNPIRTVGVEFLSTPLNNSRADQLIASGMLSEEDTKFVMEMKEKMDMRLGEFVPMNDSKVTTLEMDSIYRYPEKVAILIDENNASTSEQFLLAAKQSQKVKLYGKTTMGVLDVSNMHFVDAPCGNFQLGYSLSKSFRIPHMAIDGKGIMPDFYLGDDIKPHEWIGFVRGMIEE